MLAVIAHLKEAFPEAAILLVSVGDRELRMTDEMVNCAPCRV